MGTIIKYLLLLTLSLLIFTGCLNGPDVEEYDDSNDIAFLEEYAQRENVEMTDSGLMYRVIEEGQTDEARPGPDNFVFVKYEGVSVDQNINFSTGGELDVLLPSTLDNFSGLAEVVQLMPPDAIYEVVLPSNLALSNGRVFLFEFELESFLTDPHEFLDQNQENEDITVTETGLQYRVLEEGDGATPTSTDRVRVNYTATYVNGFIFDQSGDNPAMFELTGVISGFSEGLQLMKTGAKYELFLPPTIGYGNNPPPGSSILPGVVLVFEVELVEIL
jgi:FKBP-type peptidyl-prolyl cis-trans isomerase